MSTRHLVDPDLLPLIEMMGGRDFTAEALAQIRSDYEGSFAFLGEPALPAQVHAADGPNGPVEIYWYDPAPGTGDRPALLHIHGGGMVIGSAQAMRHSPAAIAKATGVPVA